MLRILDYVDGTTWPRTRPHCEVLGSPDGFDLWPSGLFAAYHHDTGPKEIDVYPYNQHEGGEGDADVAAIEWLQGVWS